MGRIKKYGKLATLAFFLFSSVVLAEQDDGLSVCKGIPGLKRNCWTQPCELSGNFSGTARKSKAILVSKGKEGPKGLVVILSDGSCALAGAGKAIGNGGVDLSWVQSLEIRHQYKRHVDGLSLSSESGGGVIYLSGSKWIWAQEGD
jgi:hypothetical protein